MSEKYPQPQRNSSEDEPEAADTITSDEPGGEPELELRWAISDAILAAIDNMIEQPGDASHAATRALADRLVQHVYGAIPPDGQDRQPVALLTATVTDRIIELAGAYQQLTTSDLQGAVEALALPLVRHQLISDAKRDVEGGDHE
ncbi:hypothetical protein [Nocardia sp. MW-W600-9]